MGVEACWSSQLSSTSVCMHLDVTPAPGSLSSSGNTSYQIEPKPVANMEGVRISQIAAGGWHSLALSEEGKVSDRRLTTTHTHSTGLAPQDLTDVSTLGWPCTLVICDPVHVCVICDPAPYPPHLSPHLLRYGHGVEGSTGALVLGTGQDRPSSSPRGSAVRSRVSVWCR